MYQLDTGYQYPATLNGWNFDTYQSLFLADALLSSSQCEFDLICIGSASRYPLWQHKKTRKFIGGFYVDLVSQAQLFALYQTLTKEWQVIGYQETQQAQWGRSPNPFPSTLNNRIPRHVWAWFYEAGSRNYRNERRLLELKARQKSSGGDDRI